MSRIYEMGICDIQRIALLTNPSVVGSKNAVKCAAIARQRFNDAGVDVASIQGKDMASARVLAKEMIDNDSIDALVLCGGDGVVSCALEAQANTNKPLGIIPADSGSDLARSLGIPNHPERAAEIIMRGFFTTTDLGRLTDSAGNTMWFGTIAGFGCDAQAALIARETHPKIEALRYPMAALKSLRHLVGHPTIITLDYDRVIEGDFAHVSVGNTPYYGQGMRMCPDANHHDGLLDITLMKPAPRYEMAARLPLGYLRGIETLPYASFEKAAHVRIEMPGEPITADGEFFGTSWAEVEALEGAGRFLVPRP
ncbi:diacylglycerol kinase family protein [Staphylococcus chromogenes]|nr:diacylglycerol kinase family protein [Staphylococcus chromogenes]